MTFEEINEFFDGKIHEKWDNITLDFVKDELKENFELFKDLLLFVWMDSHAVVSHLNPDFSFLKVKTDTHCALLRRAELCCI